VTVKFFPTTPGGNLKKNVLLQAGRKGKIGQLAVGSWQLEVGSGKMPDSSFLIFDL
jgi:hypothetical protein